MEILAGNGHFGLTLAQLTDLNIYLLDNSPEMLRQARNNIKRYGLETRAQTLRGSSPPVPLAGEAMDLVICRNPAFLERAQVRKLQEIYRILAPGGIACLGGGLWKGDNQPQFREPSTEPHRELRRGHPVRPKPVNFERITALAGIASYEINYSDEGLWVIFHKSAQCKEVS